MANIKFSALPDLGELAGATDTLLAVRSGATVGQVTLPSSARTFNALDYGAKFDGKILTDCTWSTSAATVSSASYTFTADDVGKCICLKDDNALQRTTTYRRVGTISSVNAGVATVSGGNMANNISGTGYCFFGTDDTDAIEDAIAAANPNDYAATGSWKYTTFGTVVLPVGMSFVTREIVMRPCVRIIGQGWRSTWLKWASTTGMGGTGYYAMFHGGNANTGGQRCYYDCHFEDFQIDMTAATIAGQTYHAKCIEAIYMVRPVFRGLFLNGSPATSIGIDYVTATRVTDCYFLNSGRLWSTGMGGSSGLDFQTNANENYTPENTLMGKPQSNIISGNFFVNCAVSAVRQTANNTTVTGNKTIIANNVILNNLSHGKGIEDNGNEGAIIIGNTIEHSGTAQSSEGPVGSEGQHIWAGIIVTGGKNGVIANNTIKGGWYDGIRLNRFQKSGSSITPLNYRVEGNTIDGATRNGIRAEIDDTYLMEHVALNNNTICNNGSHGIAFTNTGTGGNIENIHMNGNQIYNNTGYGVFFDTTTTGMCMNSNYIYDSGGATQTHAIAVDGVDVTNTLLATNHLNNNATTAVTLLNSGTLTGSIVSNYGYTP